MAAIPLSAIAAIATSLPAIRHRVPRRSGGHIAKCQCLTIQDTVHALGSERVYIPSTLIQSRFSPHALQLQPSIYAELHELWPTTLRASYGPSEHRIRIYLENVLLNKKTAVVVDIAISLLLISYPIPYRRAV